MEVDPLHRILLGAMTLILLIASLLFIGQELTALPPGQDYFIYFKESVTGLSKNSKVTYEGREVGKVKAIEEEVRENGIYSKVTLVLNSTVYQQQLRVEEVLGAPLGRTWFRPGDEILSVDGSPVLTSIQYHGALNQAMRRIETREQLEAHYGSGRSNPPHAFSVKIRRATGEVDISINTDLGYPEMSFALEGTRARLSANFVTGIQTVELVGGGKGLPTLEDGGIIPQERVGLGRLFDDLGQDVPRIVQNLTGITRQLQLFTRNLNGKDSDFSRILSNLEEITGDGGDVRQTLSGFTKTAENAASAFADIQTLLAPQGKVGVILERLSHQLSTTPGAEGDLVQTVRQARETLHELQVSIGPKGSAGQALEEIRISFARLKEAMEEDGQVATRLDEIGYVIRHDLRRSLAQLAASMQTLQESLQKMSANPNSLFFGEKTGK